MHSLLRVLIACVALVIIEVSGPVSAQAPKKIMVGDVAPIAADWWRGFDDPVLADLIQRATAGSPLVPVW